MDRVGSASLIGHRGFTWTFPARLRRGIAGMCEAESPPAQSCCSRFSSRASSPRHRRRSEEHTSELQSLAYLVCRLLLEKKKKTQALKKIQQHIDNDQNSTNATRSAV